MTGVLLIQLVLQTSPSVTDVRKYLSEFLNDPRVIDIPYVLRKFLVNVIIVPFRAPKIGKTIMNSFGRIKAHRFFFIVKVLKKNYSLR